MVSQIVLYILRSGIIDLFSNDLSPEKSSSDLCSLKISSIELLSNSLLKVDSELNLQNFLSLPL